MDSDLKIIKDVSGKTNSGKKRTGKIVSAVVVSSSKNQTDVLYEQNSIDENFVDENSFDENSFDEIKLQKTIEEQNINVEEVFSIGKKTGIALLITFIFVISVFFFVSIFDTDKTISEKENRTLKTFPAFSYEELFAGKWTGEFESYYSDTFPFRDIFLDINAYIDKFTSQLSFGGDEGVVIIETTKNEDDFAGESLSDVEK